MLCWEIERRSGYGLSHSAWLQVFLPAFSSDPGAELPQFRTRGLMHALIQSLSAGETVIGRNHHHITFDLSQVSEHYTDLSMTALSDDDYLCHRPPRRGPSDIYSSGSPKIRENWGTLIR